MSMSVCLSVHTPRAYLKKHMFELYNFLSVHVAFGLVLFRWRCNVIRTSNFWYDVKFLIVGHMST